MQMPGRILVIFGQRVREHRLAHGLTQQELANRAGLHRSYIGDVEQGKRNATLKTMDKIAKALEISVVELLPMDHPKAQED